MHFQFSPYSYSDYHLFLSLSNFLYGKKYDYLELLQSLLDSYFESKPVEFLSHKINELLNRCQQVLNNNGHIKDWNY